MFAFQFVFAAVVLSDGCSGRCGVLLLFKQNKDNVIESLNDYISNLSQFKTLIENDDFESIYKEMKDTNYIKEILNGIH